MRKKIIIGLLCSTVLMSLAPLNVHADELSDSKTKYTEISSELKNLDDEISKITTEIETINAKISDNENKIQDTEDNIKNTEKQIEELNDDINSNQNLLDNRLREMYKSGTTSSSDLIEFLAKSESLSDLLRRINSAKTIVKLDNKLINDTKNKVSTVEASKKEIEDEKANLESLHSEMQSNLDSINSKKDELSQKKVKLSEELVKISTSIEENENNLVKNQINVANTSNSSSDLQMAVSTLEGLLPQLSVQSVVNKTNDAIKTAKEKLKTLSASSSSSQVSRGDSDTIAAFNTSMAKKTLSLEATAYTAHTITAMGLTPVRVPNGISSVAVDPNVIPLGSKLYIDGYGYAIACDTGSAIKGNKIDLFMNSESDCLSFGRQMVTAYIIAYPGEW